MVKSRCAAPLKDKTRSREGEVIVVVVVVVAPQHTRKGCPILRTLVR